MIVKIYVLNYQDLNFDILLNSIYLSDFEKSSFDKYSNLDVKKERIVSAILKNKYIGDYYLNEYGKPLSNEKFFNISHSHGYIALVIDKIPVGIDIEKIRPMDDDLKGYISNEKEKEYIVDDQTFLEVWTNKEALVKANGNGINQKPNSIQALPINSKRMYDNKMFFNKTVKYEDLIITVSRQSEEDFDLSIVKEDL